MIPTLCANSSQDLRSLKDSLKGGLNATGAVEWNLEMAKAYSDAKAALCKTALLAHPQQGFELALMVDASADCVGATLQQQSSPSSP